MSEPINLATFFHPHGFHRVKGKFPGLDLYTKLLPLVQKARGESDTVNIDLNDMKALYGSFVDGAFGKYIDELKGDFFNIFKFSGGDPDFMIVINRVYSRHEHKNFNIGVSNE